MHSEKKQDVIIIGGGPAGAASALYLLQAGIKPLILEKERFPRYHIGESLTGEAGNALREFGLESFMAASRAPIKHGVTVFGPNGANKFWVPVMKRNAEGALEKATTWQVRRSTFDQKLLDLAIARGAELLPCRAVAPLIEDDCVTGSKVLTGLRIRTPQGATEDLKSKVIIDASGQATFLANSTTLTGEKERGNYDKQVAVFSQVVDAVRDPAGAAGNTLIFYRQKNHWAWFIPLDDEVTSVGVVVPGDYFNAQKLSKHDFLCQELRGLNAELARRMTNLNFVEDVHSASNYSYHVKQFTGKGFLCVGDSHRFIDPIFSFGVNFALREAQFAARAITRYLSGERSHADNPFADYQTLAERAQDVIQYLLDAFWEFPLAFAFAAHHRYREGVIDLFAGRIYDEKAWNSEALKSFQPLFAERATALAKPEEQTQLFG